MSRKSLALLFSLMLILAAACGGGKEVVDEKDLGEDDQAAQTADTASTAGSESTAAAAAPVVSADAATVAGVVKFEGAAPKMPNLQMSADSYCMSQHSTPTPDEEVVVSPAGELANV